MSLLVSYRKKCIHFLVTYYKATAGCAKSYRATCTCTLVTCSIKHASLIIEWHPLMLHKGVQSQALTDTTDLPAAAAAAAAAAAGSSAVMHLVNQAQLEFQLVVALAGRKKNR